MPERSATSTGTNNDGRQSEGGGTYERVGVVAGDADSGVLRGVGNAVRDSLGVMELIAVTLGELVDVAVASGVVVESVVTDTAGLSVGDALVEDVGEFVTDELFDCVPEVDGVLDDGVVVVTAGEVVIAGDTVDTGEAVTTEDVLLVMVVELVSVLVGEELLDTEGVPETAAGIKVIPRNAVPVGAVAKTVDVPEAYR